MALLTKMAELLVGVKKMNWIGVIFPALGLIAGLMWRYVVVPAQRRRLGRVAADAEKLKARLAKHHLGRRLALNPSDALWSTWYGDIQEELGAIDEDDRTLVSGFVALAKGRTQLLLVQNDASRLVAFPLGRSACERIAHYLSPDEGEFRHMADRTLKERVTSRGFATDTSEGARVSAEFTTRGIGLRSACELGLVEDRRDMLPIGFRQAAKWELKIHALLGKKRDRLVLVLAGFHRYVDCRHRHRRVSVALSASGRDALRQAVAKVLDENR